MTAIIKMVLVELFIITLTILIAAIDVQQSVNHFTQSEGFLKYII